MSSIDNLKTLLNFKINDGTKNIKVFVNETNKTKTNAIFLFYDNDNDILQIAKHTTGGYYTNGIQVTCRHNDYEKARVVAYNALEYISANRKTLQGVYYIPDTPPSYTGIDELSGSYTFSFNIKMKGAE